MDGNLSGWARMVSGGTLFLVVGACLAGPEMLPAPRPGEPPAKAQAGPSSQDTVLAEAAVVSGKWVPINLGTALRLAQTNNLDIQTAQQIVLQAIAQMDRAKVQALPNLTAGFTRVAHEGQIQAANGDIFPVNRDSLFVGGGPALTVSLAEAYFAPLVARQVLNATQAGQARVTNDTLLAVTEAYVAVVRARRRLDRVEKTLDTLTSEQASEMRGGSKGLLPLVRDFVEVGGKEAFQADLARMQVEVARRREEQAALWQDYRVASAELARLIRLDPCLPLYPCEALHVPLPLADEHWAGLELEHLVKVALNNRPETAENQALVQAAIERLRLAKWRPFVPTLAVNYLEGGFGGSPIDLGDNAAGETVRSPSGRIYRFAHRSDIDVGLVWRVQNLGFGNEAEKREQRALSEQAALRQLFVHDRIAAQVVQGHALVVQGRSRVQISHDALFDDRGDPLGPVYRSLRLNFERIRGAEGRPLEVLDSVRGLNDVLDQLAVALSDYDRGRFRLLIALGIGPDGLCPPAPAVPPQQPAVASPEKNEPEKQPGR